MHRSIPIIFLFVLCRIAGIAQADTLSSFRIIRDDTIDIFLPDSTWQILADDNGKLSFDDVVSGSASNQFRKYSPGFKLTENFWVRYRLINVMDHDARILVGSNANYFDLYSSTDGRYWKHYRTGFFVPWSERAGLKPYRTIPITIKPGDSHSILKRMQYDFRFNYQESAANKISFADVFIQTWYIEDSSYQTFLVLSAIVFGIFMIAMVINFFFYIVSKEKVILYFAFSLLFIGMFYFSDNLYLLVFKERPVVFAFLVPVLLALTLFFTLNTLRLFLQVQLYYPRWNKFLQTLSVIPFIVLAGILFFHARMIVFEWLPVLIFISAFITALLFLKNKTPAVRLTIIAVLPVFFFTGLMMAVILIAQQLEEAGYIKIPESLKWFLNNRDYFEYICQIWLIMVFSWSFFKRFQLLQQQIAAENLEKERLAKEREMEKNEMIAAQKLELEKQVAERTAELKKSLTDLKETQAHLIQSEKMASLGELTAGIAHEIQNPLNFVNNFSDVNRELIDDLNDEIDRGNTREAKQIAESLKDNEKKVNHHGKRAEAIVRGMLQHSRTSAGVKEPTDLNALCDEYLRLSYHGLRAKDKNFNAELKIDLDPSVGRINIIPQDIGRVLLNLFNNAFYSVAEKKRLNGSGYSPIVELKTLRKENIIKISVSDNGMGIPEKLREKIFQPFFTTKPTGQGTGLGLSLSYDIVKAHGGEINVTSIEGQGSEFLIKLNAGT